MSNDCSLLVIGEENLLQAMQRLPSPSNLIFRYLSNWRNALKEASQSLPAILCTASPIPGISEKDLLEKMSFISGFENVWTVSLLPPGQPYPSDPITDDCIEQKRLGIEWSIRINAGLKAALHRREAVQLREKISILRSEQERDQDHLKNAASQLIEMTAQLRSDLIHNEEEEEDKLLTARLDVVEQAAIALRHEINNPLFVISGSVESAIRQVSRLEGQGTADLTGLKRNLDRIQQAEERIEQAVQAISAKLHPGVTQYAEGISMLDLKLPSKTAE